jgi:hypothetical protein
VILEHTIPGRHVSTHHTLMNSQEAFRRFAQQVQRAGGQGGGGFSGGPGKFLAGGGLLATLIGGGLLLNASLFNGACFYSFYSLRESCGFYSKSTVVTVPSSIRGKHGKPASELIYPHCLVQFTRCKR